MSENNHQDNKHYDHEDFIVKQRDFAAYHPGHQPAAVSEDGTISDA